MPTTKRISSDRSFDWSLQTRQYLRFLISQGVTLPAWGVRLLWDNFIESYGPLPPRNLAAYYPNDPNAIILDGSGNINLWSDMSGNSAVNCLCLNGVNANGATATTATAFGTADFTVSMRLRASSLAAGMTLMQGGANSFSLAVVITTGVLQTGLPTVGNNTASTGAISVFADCVVTYVRSGSTGTYYINGVAAGTTVDSRDYSVASLYIGQTSVATVAFNGNIFWARHYSVALDAAGVLADANGTLQTNSTFNVDFRLASKLATSFTATTGGTVTINTSGDTGARISGERDLYQGTTANRPTWTAATPIARGFATFDGSGDYLKSAAFSLSQPESVYFVGSQVTWTALDGIYDGNSTNEAMSLYQRTATPQLDLYCGSAGTAINGGLALSTSAVVTAVFNNTASSLRVNRTAATGSGAAIGNQPANGFILGANRLLGAPSNITVREVAIYSEAHTSAVQDLVINYLSSKFGISL